MVNSCRHASRWRTSSANIASVAAPVDGMADGGGIRDCSSDVSLSHTWPRGVVMACKAGVGSCLVGVSDEAAYGIGPVGAGGGPPVLERAKAAFGGTAGGGLAYVVWGSQQHAFLVGAADGLVCASWCQQVDLVVQAADGVRQVIWGQQKLPSLFWCCILILFRPVGFICVESQVLQ